jgi:hypothetical protein
MCVTYSALQRMHSQFMASADNKLVVQVIQTRGIYCCSTSSASLYAAITECLTWIPLAQNCLRDPRIVMMGQSLVATLIHVPVRSGQFLGIKGLVDI